MPVPVGITPFEVLVLGIFPPREQDQAPALERATSTNSQYSSVEGDSTSITCHRFVGAAVPEGIGTESAQPVPEELLPPLVLVVTFTRGVDAVAVTIMGASS